MNCLVPLRVERYEAHRSCNLHHGCGCARRGEAIGPVETAITRRWRRRHTILREVEGKKLEPHMMCEKSEYKAA